MTERMGENPNSNSEEKEVTQEGDRIKLENLELANIILKNGQILKPSPIETTLNTSQSGDQKWIEKINYLFNGKIFQLSVEFFQKDMEPGKRFHNVGSTNDPAAEQFRLASGEWIKPVGIKLIESDLLK